MRYSSPEEFGFVKQDVISFSDDGIDLRILVVLFAGLDVVFAVLDDVLAIVNLLSV